ncbi:amidohydrolase family protein [Thermincola potens]|uniref:Amidohydrolase 2 n=1 Tax=Thermincola potens (strain JR) TaxID=635013 RepID=D5X7E0_THEPJ|nr:amidohydrolase family protein [Thermincola potens]ADG82510.1 amidohydrolase 2 [Thermincola potens JR]
MAIIDFHTHAFPEKIAHLAVNQLANHYKISIAGMGTLSDLLQSAQEAGITKLCLHAAATNPDQVQINNNWIAKQCSDNIIGFGSIHVDYPDPFSELDRMETLGLTGIKFHAEFQQFAIDDPRMWPVYEAIEDRFLVMFHVGDRKSDLSHPARLKRVIESFPKMKIIAAHLGGWSKWQEAKDYLLGKDIYIDTSSTTWILPPVEIARLIRSHDINKVLFGTDYPVAKHKQELEAFHRIPLTSAEREKILWKNGADLLAGRQ